MRGENTSRHRHIQFAESRLLVREARSVRFACAALAVWLVLPGGAELLNAQNSLASKHASRAAQLVQAGDLRGAEAEIRQAVELSPKETEYLIRLGLILSMQQRPKVAALFFERALKLDPNNLTLRRHLAGSQWQSGRLDAAQENLELILKANPRDLEALLTGAAWLDYDRDGWLDLVICHYGQMSFASAPRCDFRGTPTYCAPSAYGKGAPLALYRSNGNGSFADASTMSGIDKDIGRGLGVVAVDVDDDGWTDLFVARDGSPNLLLMNQRNGTFRDCAMEAEVAYDPNGVAKAGMGIDAADVNGDGRPDFVMTTFNNEQHSLFMNPGKFPFEDWTIASGLGFLTMPYVGWGTRFLDYDNDGIIDLLIVSGHVNKIVELTSSNVTYKELPLLLRNDGRGNFRNMQESAGPAFQAKYDARGLAVGDYDNDGDVDAALVRLQDTPVPLA